MTQQRIQCQCHHPLVPTSTNSIHTHIKYYQNETIACMYIVDTKPCMISNQGLYMYMILLDREKAWCATK